MTSVEVRLVSETVLPHWEDRARADSVLAAEWDTYIGRLRTHENNHRAIAYRGAREVHRQLKRLTSPNCSTMSAWANQAAQGVLRRYNERNRDYDEETAHGRTEGVAWPVSPAADPPTHSDALKQSYGPGGGLRVLCWRQFRADHLSLFRSSV